MFYIISNYTNLCIEAHELKMFLKRAINGRFIYDSCNIWNIEHYMEVDSLCNYLDEN